MGYDHTLGRTGQAGRIDYIGWMVNAERHRAIAIGRIMLERFRSLGFSDDETWWSGRQRRVGLGQDEDGFESAIMKATRAAG